MISTSHSRLLKTFSAPALATGFATVLLSGTALAQDSAPTFYADALPLFQKNCVACHQPDGPKVGGITAPMSLMDYDQAKLWAPMIKNALITGYMPPWGAHEREHRTQNGCSYSPDSSGRCGLGILAR